MITLTAYCRPYYLREVLAGLANCTGVGEWRLHAQVEPSDKCDENVDLIRAFDACERTWTVNDRRLGLNRNTYRCLEHVNRNRADVWAHLEDDTVPSPDALLFFDWAIQEVLAPDVKFRDGHHILFASGYNKPSKEPKDQTPCHTRPVF